MTLGAQNRIVLTDWAADTEYICPGRRLNSLFWELFLQSLIREEILIQDEAIILSERFASWFVDGKRLAILDELFDLGTVVILKRPSESYPTPELRDMAQREPLRARLLYNWNYVVRGSNPFEPTLDQEFVPRRLDMLLANHPQAHRSTGRLRSFDINARFARALVEVLTNEFYRPWLRSAFGGITNQMRDAYVQYATRPQTACDQIRAAGMDLRVGERTEFSRAMGFQVSNTYSIREARSMQNLLQTVFAKVFTEREMATGRYSSALRECLHPGARLEGEIPEDADLSFDTSVEVPVRLPQVRPGFARVLADVRQSVPGKRLRALVAARAPFEKQQQAWQGVAEELAVRLPVFKPAVIRTLKVSSRRMARGLAIGLAADVALTRGSGIPLIAGRFAAALSLDVFTMYWRAHAKRQTLRKQLERALVSRCSRLPVVVNSDE